MAGDRRDIRTPGRTIGSMAKKLTANVDAHVAVLAQDLADHDHSGNLSAVVNRALKEYVYREMGRRRTAGLASLDDAQREAQITGDEAEETQYRQDRARAAEGRRGAA